MAQVPAIGCRFTCGWLEARGFDDPFVTVQLGETQDGRQIVFMDPKAGPLSAHDREVGTIVQTFGLPLRDLRTDLEKKVARAMTRKHGQVRKVRGLHGGQAVVAGTRVPAAKIGALSAADWDESRSLQAFPYLNPADITAALQYQRRLGARSA